MLKPAFSTVACPSWTLDHVVKTARDLGFMGVELRSFGYEGGPVVSDPGLTSGEKVRRLFADAGLTLTSIASGATFEQPIKPPVLGHLLGIDNKVIDRGREYIDIASACAGEYVRFFGFSIPPRERRASALRRICERLARVCDHARNRDVKVTIENGGSFPLAADLQDIIDRVKSPLLFASYDIATAHSAGENPAEAALSIASRLAMVRIRDLRDEKPCRLGQGQVPCQMTVTALRDAGSSAWLMYTWDRLWLPELDSADRVLPDAAKLLYQWISRSGRRTAAA